MALARLLSSAFANSRSEARCRTVLLKPAPSTKPPPLPPGKSLRAGRRGREHAQHERGIERPQPRQAAGHGRCSEPLPTQGAPGQAACVTLPPSLRTPGRRPPAGQAMQEPEQLPGGCLPLQLLCLLLEGHVPAVPGRAGTSGGKWVGCEQQGALAPASRGLETAPAVWLGRTARDSGRSLPAAALPSLLLDGVWCRGRRRAAHLAARWSCEEASSRSAAARMRQTAAYSRTASAASASPCITAGRTGTHSGYGQGQGRTGDTPEWRPGRRWARLHEASSGN